MYVQQVATHLLTQLVALFCEFRPPASIVATLVRGCEGIEVVTIGGHVACPPSGVAKADISIHLTSHQCTDVTTISQTVGHLKHVFTISVVVQVAHRTPDVTIVRIQLVGILCVTNNLGTLLLSNLVVVLPILDATYVKSVHFAHAVNSCRVMLDVRVVSKLIAVTNAPSASKQSDTSQQSLGKTFRNTLTGIIANLTHPRQIANGFLHVAHQCRINLVTTGLSCIDIAEVTLRRSFLIGYVAPAAHQFEIGH